MKKNLLIVMLMAAACQLRAQTFAPFNPADSTLSARIKSLKIKPFDSLLTLKPGSPLFSPNRHVNLLAKNNISISPFDHMPIYKMPGNSKMSIISLPGYSKMPVIDPDIKQKLILKKPEVIEVPKP